MATCFRGRGRGDGRRANGSRRPGRYRGSSRAHGSRICRRLPWRGALVRAAGGADARDRLPDRAEVRAVRPRDAETADKTRARDTDSNRVSGRHGAKPGRGSCPRVSGARRAGRDNRRQDGGGTAEPADGCVRQDHRGRRFPGVGLRFPRISVLPRRCRAEAVLKVAGSLSHRGQKRRRAGTGPVGRPRACARRAPGWRGQPSQGRGRQQA